MYCVILIIVIFILFFVLIIGAPTNFIYMFIFEHEEWKQWRYFYKNVDKFEFCVEGPLAYEFKWGEYMAYIWKNGHSSIHTANDCICCCFWELKSRKFANKLLEKENRNGKRI